jgi:branched-chain amino acid transport system permease protein
VELNKLFNTKNIKTAVGVVGLYGVMQLLIMFNILSDYYQITLTLICINIILAVSLNLITGFTGQFSLGHAGFMSIGAYSSALITMSISEEYSFFAGIVVGALLAAAVGLIIGIPTLRLKGDYLAIATLGMGEIIKIIVLNLGFTGGAAGLSGIPQYTNWTWLFIFTAGTVIIVKNFIDSSHGRACKSIREDEIASESMGINTTKYKVLAFVIGAFCAGIAGALYSSYFYYIKPDMFGFLRSIDILVIVVIGGMGSIGGSIVSAILLAVVSLYLQDFPEIRMILYSLILVVAMVVREKYKNKKIKFNGFPWKKPEKIRT